MHVRVMLRSLAPCFRPADRAVVEAGLADPLITCEGAGLFATKVHACLLQVLSVGCCKRPAASQPWCAWSRPAALLLAVGKLPVRTASEALKGMKHLRRHAAELALPLWVHHGAADK